MGVNRVVLCRRTTASPPTMANAQAVARSSRWPSGARNVEPSMLASWENVSKPWMMVWPSRSVAPTLSYSSALLLLVVCQPSALSSPCKRRSRLCSRSLAGGAVTLPVTFSHAPRIYEPVDS